MPLLWQEGKKSRIIRKSILKSFEKSFTCANISKRSRSSTQVGEGASLLRK